MPTPGLTGSRNPALRTIGGASLFEGTPAKTGVNAGPLAKPAGVGSPLGIPGADPLDAQQAAVAEALAGNGRPVDFVNSAGRQVQLTKSMLSMSSTVTPMEAHDTGSNESNVSPDVAATPFPQE